MGTAIDIQKRWPLLGNVTGGLSGPAVKPVALHFVWQVSDAVKLPVIGMGGISSAEDAVEFLLAGASAVAIGTANFINPLVCLEVIDGIAAYLQENNFNSVGEIIVLAKKGKAG